MAVDSVTGVSETVASAAAVPLAHDHPSPSQVALADAQAKEQETDEQLAAGGDRLAIDKLEQAYARLTPTSSQHLEPAVVHHAAGAVEPGKGELIDVYD